MTSHIEKEGTIQKHFEETLAPPAPRNTDLNWEVLNPPTPDLHNLQDVFTETEVLNALEQLPGGKALGPEGLFKFLQIMLVNHQSGYHGSFPQLSLSPHVASTSTSHSKHRAYSKKGGGRQSVRL